MQKYVKRASIVLVLLAAMTGPAHAHPGHGTNSLFSGLAHPFAGLDHLLAMLAVGLWAAPLGGRIAVELRESFNEREVQH